MNYIQQGIKVGDKVWTIQDGDTEIAEVDIKTSHPITTKSGYWYMADGKTSPMHDSPSLFWSKPYDTLPGKPEPPKYQWLFRQKGDREWFLLEARFTEDSIKRISQDTTWIEYRRVEEK